MPVVQHHPIRAVVLDDGGILKRMFVGGSKMLMEGVLLSTFVVKQAAPQKQHSCQQYLGL